MNVNVRKRKKKNAAKARDHVAPCRVVQSYIDVPVNHHYVIVLVAVVVQFLNHGDMMSGNIRKNVLYIMLAYTQKSAEIDNLNAFANANAYILRKICSHKFSFSIQLSRVQQSIQCSLGTSSTKFGKIWLTKRRKRIRYLDGS